MAAQRQNKRHEQGSTRHGSSRHSESGRNRRRDSGRRGQSRKRQNRSQPGAQQRSGKSQKSDGKLSVLVIGSGGREHALVWKLSQSDKVGKIHAAPGSSAISELARCVDIKIDKVKELAQYAYRNHIQLTVVGPEIPLEAGIVDEFTRRKLKIFGPTKAASELEWSKSFSKEFMRRHNIPTGSFRVFTNPNHAITFCRTAPYPLVIKADGLAAGKGVVVVDDFIEACKSIDDFMTRRKFGKAGAKIVVEEFLCGREVSVMCFSDSEKIWALLPSQDHKRIGEGDSGPNTGGMGAYCPVEFVDEVLMREITSRVLAPCIAGLASEGRPYKGVLYAGLMLTENGPKVLEFNCRFGDPETQVVLPLLKSDLAQIMLKIANHQLPGPSKKTQKPPPDAENRLAKKSDPEEKEDTTQERAEPIYLRDLVSDYEYDPESDAATAAEHTLEWRPGAAATVTLASEGYPGKASIGKKISGISSKSDASSIVFHAGSRKINGAWVTSGGRVLNVTGLGPTIAGALSAAYATVGKISFSGMQYRRDIGRQVSDRKIEKAVK